MEKSNYLSDKIFLRWLQNNEILYDKNNNGLIEALYAEFYIEQSTKKKGLKKKLNNRLRKN